MVACASREVYFDCSATFFFLFIVAEHARPSDRVSMPSSSSSVAGAKGRSKTALGPGYSLMAWMRLSQGADLSGGVGAIDPDEDEAKWKEWDVR